MSDKPHAEYRLKRFLRAHFPRMAIGTILTAGLYVAISIYMPFARERKIAAKITKSYGTVSYQYVGPTWLPGSVQARSPFFRVRSVQIFTSHHRGSELQNIVAELRHLERLTELTLSDYISSHLPNPESPYPKNIDLALQQVQRFPELQRLAIGRREVTDAGLFYLRDLPCLEDLYLYDCAITDAGLEYLRHLTTIRRLDLAWTKVSNLGLDHLNAFSNLEQLSLEGTAVTDTGLERLRGLKHLKSLSLRSTEIGDEGLANLTTLAQLEDLDLENTRVTDGGLQRLRVFKRLRLLRLDDAKTSNQGRTLLRSELPNCVIRP